MEYVCHMCLVTAHLLNQVAGGLMNYACDVDGAGDAVCTVSSSVHEIREGLLQQLTLPESCHWDFKLVSLCTWRTLATCRQLLNANASRDCIVPSLGIIYSLPDWNYNFYFELIKQNDWVEYFIQVVDVSRRTFGSELLNKMLVHLNETKLDGKTADMMVDVLEYLFLTHNGYLCDGDVFSFDTTIEVEKSSALWNPIDTLLQRLLSYFDCQKSTLDLRLLLSLINALAFIVSGSSVLLAESACLDPSHPTSVFDVKQKCSTMSGSDDILKKLLDYNLIKLPVIEFRTQKRLGSIDCVADTLAKVARSLCLKSDLSALSSLLTGRSYWCGGGILRHIHPGVRSELYCEIFTSACKEIAASDFDNDQLDIQQLLEVMKPTVDSVVSFMCQRELSRCEPREQFERALFIVNERLDGYQNCCEWLLKTNHVETVLDVRWTQLLIDNVVLFGSTTDGVLSLMLAMIRNKQYLTASQLENLQKALMQVYAALAVRQQNEVMEGLYFKSPGQQQLDLLTVNPEGHSAELLSVLNRMTADVSDLSIIASKLSCLALLRPLETIDRLIERAVKDKGHGSCVIQILSLLPTLTRIRNERHQLAIVHSVDCRLSLCSGRELRNLTAFCQQLLSTIFDVKGSGDEQSAPPLCLANEFLNSCIIHHLSGLIVHSADQCVSNFSPAALPVLSLLKTVLEFTENVEWTEADCSKLVPVVFYLSQVIETCVQRSLAGFIGDLGNKELAAQALTSLMKPLVRNRSSIPGVLLLCNLLQSIPTTLQAIITRSDKRVGEEPATAPDVKGVWELLMFASVSDSNSKVASDDAVMDAVRCQQHFYAQLVHAVSCAMLWCTPSEFQRVVRVILDVISSFLSTSTCRGRHHNCTSVFCKVLSHSVQFSLTATTEPSSDQLQCHISNYYTAAVKACLVETKCGRKIYEAASVIGFILTILDAIVSHDAKETLCILTLDVLATVEQPCKTADDLDVLRLLASAVSEQQTDMQAIAQKLHQMISCSS